MTDLLERLTQALADRYTIERELGRGGMAIVYQAQDLKHERLVAMKVLRPELAAALGPERFLQEIKIAANLHHPHILPLYDSGEADGFLYYVMPYVEGESLRDRLDREKQLAIDDALQVAREVADALSYAHGHGVIHRDIKPENILLESGHAVVADFGIARAVDAAGGERLTETGIAIGTPTYLSPEQAGGEKDLDGRSDLYSLGCVLHEMLAGQPPFTGPTVESLVHQHLSAEPPSVTAIRPSVPGWVVAALERSLAKTPADRFNPVAQFGEAISPRGAAAAADLGSRLVVSGNRRWVARLAGAAALIIVAAVVLSRSMASGPITITTSNARQVTNEPGIEYQPAISPDGSEVAYVEGPTPNTRVVVRSAVDIGSGGESRLSDELDIGSWFPAWTPDGASIRFFACATQPVWRAGGCDAKEVGKHGGPVRTVAVPRDSTYYAWSRDGTRMAFQVRDSIFAYSVDDGTVELLGVHVVQLPGGGPLHSLAWSPDGEMIAYVKGNAAWRTTDNPLSASVWILDADGGEPVRATDDGFMDVSPQWLPDSRHLLFVSNRGGARRGIYVVEVGREGPRSSPRAVPGASDPHSISVSHDGRRLAYSNFTARKNIWSIPLPRSGSVSIKDAVPVTNGNQTTDGFSLSPDGEWIVFASDRRGSQDVYKQRLTGGDPQLIAHVPGDAAEPDWSGDGTDIAFYASDQDGILVVSSDGGALQQISDFPDANRPDWSRDGLTLAFQASRHDTIVIWTVARDSVGAPWSTPLQLTDFPCGAANWAPDGASLLCYMGRGVWGHVSKGGLLQTRYDANSLDELDGLGALEFSPDGSRIYAIGTEHDGSEGIWWIPVGGGKATKVVAFDDPLLTPWGMIAVGPENLYLTIAEYESDIYVMDLEW
jgi:serine/threonine-protein kinase